MDSNNFIEQNFGLEKTLCPAIFTKNDDGEYIIKADVRKKLLTIADIFLKSIGIDKLEYEDVILVGSMVNYNWSDYSDIDLHLVIDYKDISENHETSEILLKAKKDLFNIEQDLTINEFEIELGTQDINENLESAGVYSVFYNKWIKQPKKEGYDIDKQVIFRKYNQFLEDFKKVKEIKDFKKRLDAINKLADKIKRYRKAGLKANGELGVENLVFKYLRRIGFIDTLKRLKTLTINRLGSLE